MTTGKNCLYKWLWSPGHTYILFSIDIPPSSERVVRNLKNSLRERVDLEGQPHYSRKELSIMDLGTFPHNFIIDS